MKKRLLISKPGRREMKLVFNKIGDEKELGVMIKAFSEGDYTLKVLSDHKVGNSYGKVVVKGVIKNGARVLVEGMIKIREEANGVDDFLEIRLLLLDSLSLAEAIPKLEIEANEVKASHAAVVSKLSAIDLFYLVSRGINLKEAEELIINGFLKFDES